MGAAGGAQAAGGGGGDGGGGTVKLFASVVDGTGASVNAAGGQGALSAPNGGNGRFLLGNNTGTAFAGSVNATQENFDGSRDTNPFVDGGVTQTPYIPGLEGGAEVYGKTGLDASDAGFRAELSALFDTLPGQSVAALYRMDVGPTGFDDDYDQFDMLLYIVLTDTSIDAPKLGTDSMSLQQLLERGMDANPLLGGSGASNLGQLGGYKVLCHADPRNGPGFCHGRCFGGDLTVELHG